MEDFIDVHYAHIARTGIFEVASLQDRIVAIANAITFSGVLFWKRESRR